MRRGDYILLAAALRSSRPNQHFAAENDEAAGAWEQWERDVRAVADALERDAPGFDRDQFLVNCGSTPYVCSDFHPDRDVPGFCEGCKQPKSAHKGTPL